MQADTIANAAERAGKKVAQIDWVGGPQRRSPGPTVDFTNFFSNRGVLVGAADAAEQAGLGVLRRRLPGRGASRRGGLDERPAGRPGRDAEADDVAPTRCRRRSPRQNPNRTYDVYFYDSVVGGGASYDRVIVSPVGKNGAAPSITSPSATSRRSSSSGADGLIGARAGQTAGFYMKLISLAPDGSQFKLYFTSLDARDRDLRRGAATASRRRRR